MKESHWKELKKWVIGNYRYNNAATSISADFKEGNICFIELEWIYSPVGKRQRFKATYEGIYDETFYPLAKAHLDAQFLEQWEQYPAELKGTLLHMLN